VPDPKPPTPPATPTSDSSSPSPAPAGDEGDSGRGPVHYVVGIARTHIDEVEWIHDQEIEHHTEVPEELVAAIEERIREFSKLTDESHRRIWMYWLPSAGHMQANPDDPAYREIDRRLRALVQQYNLPPPDDSSASRQGNPVSAFWYEPQGYRRLGRWGCAFL
jgi:hypothetical protein